MSSFSFPIFDNNINGATNNNESRGTETRRNRNTSDVRNRSNLGIQPLYIRNRNSSSSSQNQNEQRRQNVIIDLFKEYNKNFQTYQTNYTQIIQRLQNPQEIQMEYESNNRRYHDNIKKIIDILYLFTGSNNNNNPQPSSIFSPPLSAPLSTQNENERETPTPPPTQSREENENENDLWRNIFPFYIIEPALIPSSSSSTSSFITVDEINQYVDYIIYNPEEHDNDCCPISHDNFINGETICKIKICSHVFKTQHLFNWLRINATCPVCRNELRPLSTNNNPSPSVSNSDMMYLINDVIRNINFSSL
jgi:hypothetical protein